MFSVSFSKAAFLTGAAFFILATSFSSAAEKKKTENYRDIIDKASNLALQKDRAQAMNVLLAALKREPPNSAATQELKTALQEISVLFLNDKTQQLYELGLSLKRTDLNQAQAKIGEALRLEPDNAILLNESARIQMAKGDCNGAFESMTKQRKTNPYDETSLLVQAQAAVCAGETTTYATLRPAFSAKTGAPLPWLYLDLERSLKEKAELKAREAAEKAKKLDPHHPELSYWMWRIEKEPTKQLGHAQKYLTVCKNLSAGTYRQYMMDPMLCRRTAELETFVKNSGGAQ